MKKKTLVMVVLLLANSSLFLSCSPKDQPSSQVNSSTTPSSSPPFNTPSGESGPVWARIILDQELFPNGEVWKTAEQIYKAAKGFGMASPDNPNELFGSNGALDKAELSVDVLSAKYGQGVIVMPSTTGNDKDVTFHIYGPIAFGIKPGDKYFSWLRAETRFFERGFITMANMAQENSASEEPKTSQENTSKTTAN